jgi:hypothetical protein
MTNESLKWGNIQNQSYTNEHNNLLIALKGWNFFKKSKNLCLLNLKRINNIENQLLYDHIEKRIY